VTETFKLISKLTFVDLLRRLQGRRPEEAAPLPPRKDKDDLLSWKDSLLNRPTPAAVKRPLSLVPPSANIEEAPFEAAEDAPVPEALAEVDGPFTEASTSQQMPESAAVAPAHDKVPDRPTERIEYLDPLEAARLAAPLFPTQPSEPIQPIRVSKPAPAAPVAPVAPPAPATQTTPSSALGHPPPVAASLRPEPAALDQTQAIQPQAVEPQREVFPPAFLKETAPRRAPAPAALSVPAPAVDDAKIQALESRLARAEEALSLQRADRSRSEEVAAELETRLEAAERSERDLTRSLTERQDGLSQRLETLEKATLLRQKETEPRLRAVEERLDRGEKRQRTAEDDVSLALRTLSERGEKLHQQIEDIAEQLVALDRSLQDKTSQTRRESDDIRAQFDALQMVLEEKTTQGRREAEDIRLQLAPLLEAQGKGSQTHEHLLSEFDRLRESLADAMGERSERLRNAMRGL
jgi:hypothetical protein